MGTWRTRLRSFLRTRVGLLTTAAVVAMAATAGVVSLESQRRVTGHPLLALRIAQQSAAQAEALVLEARQHQERDPIGWALSRLAQGGDSRVIRIVRARVAAEAPAESGEWNEETGTLVFKKRLPSEDGESGGTWWVQVGFLGFMGARSRFTSELGALVVFLSLSTLLYRLLTQALGPLAADEKRAPEKTTEVPALLALAQAAVPSFAEREEKLRIQLESQYAAQRAALQGELVPHLTSTQQGFVNVTSQVRDLLKRIQQFAVRARVAQSQVEDSRRRHHGNLNEVHEARNWLIQAQRDGLEVEERLKRASFEWHRAGLANGPVSSALEASLEWIAAHRSGLHSCQAVVGRLESVLEPRAMDWDLLARALAEAMRELNAACETLPPTAQALVAQAQTLEELEEAIRAHFAETEASHVSEVA